MTFNRRFIHSGTLSENLERFSAKPPVEHEPSSLCGSEVRQFYESLFTPTSTTLTSENNQSISDKHFCDLCLLKVDDIVQHMSSSGHRFAAIRSQPPRLPPLPVAPTNKGYQMLKRIGWLDPAYHSSDQAVDPVERGAPIECTTGGGLGPLGQGRRYPVSTILRRSRSGLGAPRTSHDERPRVTHFAANDRRAVESRYATRLGQRAKLIPVKEQYLRERRVERRLRDQLSDLSEEHLAILHGR